MNSVNFGSMSIGGFAAVGIGAALGAWLRWLMSVALNSLMPLLPLGTLTANLAGGLMSGAAVSYIVHHGALAPNWRLFIVTGFLGGLTTFSTFSAEAMLLLQQREYGWALAHSATHLVGSIFFCVAGYVLVEALK